MLIKSLQEIGLTQSDFPLYYQDSYISFLKASSKDIKVFIFNCESQKSLLVFSLTGLKSLNKGQYLFTPCDYQGIELEAINEKKILEEFHEYVRIHQLMDVIYPPSHVCLFKTYPTKCLYYPFGLISYSISDKKGDFYNAMKSNYRNEVRKIENNPNFVFKFGELELKDSYELIKKTHEIQGLHFDNYEVFESLNSYLFSNYFSMTCELNNELLGTVIILLDNKKAYYLYSGNQKSKEYPGINKVLLIRSFNFLMNRGVDEIILGGYRDEATASSKIKGIQNFKLRFGSEVVHGFHFIKVFNPLKFKLFTNLLQLKSFLLRKKYSIINLEGINLQKS